MKKVISFILYALLFFAVIFGILYGGEHWVFHHGKTMRSILIDSGVAAAVFAIALAMVGRRSERDEIEKEEKTEKRKRERDLR